MLIIDATPAGEKLRSYTLDSLTEQMTVREIIRARIWQEVADYNQKCGEIFNGLVQPTDAERTLNGYRVKERGVIDWEQQFARACEAFEHNGFLLLIGDRQADSLDESFEVRVDTEVQFVKLVALIGG
ncbi:MAG: hypothetical protein RL088_1068 [Verrucomicrobiota bacterium]|jgi:hypothetical protein